MGLKSIHLSATSDFLPVAHATRLAFETPPNALNELYFPLYVHLDPSNPDRSSLTAPAVRAACIDEAAGRMQTWHATDPTSNWIVVVDDEGDETEVLGAALWHVYKSDPYTGSGAGEGQDEVDDHDGCTWFPEGEERELAEQLLEQFWTPRRRYMRCPHVFLDILFTTPHARRRGVGRVLMDWGIQAADTLHLPSYIDATSLGRKLYHHYGFVATSTKQEFDLAPLKALLRTEQVREVAGMVTPFEWWPMWRPAGGQWGDGVKAPWDRDVTSSSTATVMGQGT